MKKINLEKSKKAMSLREMHAINVEILPYTRKNSKLNALLVIMNIVNSFFKEKLINKGVDRYNSKPTSIANYSPYKYFNKILYISGQLPIINGKLKYSGKIGKDIHENDLDDCILICVSNLLWNVNDFLENTQQKIDNVSCLNLRGYFNTLDDYEEHSKQLDKASTFIVHVLGSKHGKHSRVAIGCSSLPKNSPVEIEAIFSIL